MKKNLLTVNNLEKHFEISGGLFSRNKSVVKAVDGISFDIPFGSSLGLVGQSGCGKTTTARIVAKMLNCTVFDNNKSPDLDNCEQAKAITEDRHPDVIEIDAASNTSVENARDIIENVKYNPVLGKYKVYIIDEVHMLSKPAFNASCIVRCICLVFINLTPSFSVKF